MQEVLDEVRSAMTEGKRNMTVLTGRVHSLQSDLSQSELRRGELEAELAHTQEVRESSGFNVKTA